MEISSEAIVIKKVKINGGKAMVSLFTREYGKLSCSSQIRESKRTKSSLLTSPFTIGNFNIYKGRGYYHVNSGDVIKSNYEISQNLDRYVVASMALELADKLLLEEVKEENLYKLLSTFLSLICKKEGDFGTILIAYEVKLLMIYGMMPRLDVCVNCGSKEALDFFSITDGGLLCKKCKTMVPEVKDKKLIYENGFDIAKLLVFFAKNPLQKFQSLSLTEDKEKLLKEILRHYFAEHLGVKELKTEKLFTT